jgi:hypothetical protein
MSEKINSDQNPSIDIIQGEDLSSIPQDNAISNLKNKENGTPQDKAVPYSNYEDGKQIIPVKAEIIKDRGVGLSARIQFEKDQANEIFLFALNYQSLCIQKYPNKLCLYPQLADDRSTEFYIDRYFGITYILLLDEYNIRKSLSIALRSVKRLERYIFNRVIHENLWFDLMQDEENSHYA